MSSFVVGSGGKYSLNLVTGPSELSIIIADKKPKKVAVEFYFNDSRSDWMPIQMWQQYHLQLKSIGGLKLSEGYIYMQAIGAKPQKLPSEYMQGFDGLNVSTFMAQSEEELKQFFIGKEKVTVPAGTVEALHYRVKENGRVVDFWISEEAKPIGLVKLVTTGGKLKKYNYSMELKSLIKNARKRIDPAKSVPLNNVGKSFLPKVSGQMLMY